MRFAACLLALVWAALRTPEAVRGAEATPDAAPEPERLAKALAGPDAVAEHEASARLVALGDAAVPALAHLAGAPGPLPPRLLAIERLGQIGTRAALDALLGLLKTEQDLAVRGQLCMQLGHARERRAIPVIADWLRRMSSRSLADVPGPKEKQPSTCYIRHVEALEMIGDESAIAILEEIAPAVPRITPEGFIRAFVSEAVRQAIESLREEAAFWNEVRRYPGLEEKLGPLFAWFRSSPLARLRLHEDEVMRRIDRGRQVLQRLAKHPDPKVAAGANALLEHFEK